VKQPQPQDDKREAALPARGRPALSSDRNVYVRLMDATVACLNRGTFDKIKVLDIAAEAGVNPAMINYYFGGKLGLFAALIRFVWGGWLKGLAQLTNRIGDPACDPIEDLIDLFFDTFYRRPGVVQLLRREHFVENSALRQNFNATFASRSAAGLRKYIAAGVAAGRFSPSMNVRYAAYLVSMVAVQPAGLGANLKSAYGIDPAELLSSDWRQFASGMLRGLLLPLDGDNPPARLEG